MPVIKTTRPALFATAPISRAFQAGNPILASIRKWNDVRVTRNALSSLSDRELDDIGLCRGDIDQIGG